MTLEEKRKGWILCEICNIEGATDIKGGTYEGKSDMFMVCKNCKDKIKDRRLRI